MNKNNKIIAAVVVVVLMIASFYGGMAYAKSGTMVRGAFANGAAFTRGMGTGAPGAIGARGAGGFTAGDILSRDASSITIKMPDGSTKIVLVATSTTVMKSAAGSLSDLSEGTSVTVTGTTNSDGSVTAQSIQIRPAGMGVPGRGTQAQ